MDDERLEAFVKLAVRTGRMYVAQDVYDALKPHFPLPEGVLVMPCKWLKCGTALAVDEAAFTSDLWKMDL